MTATLSNNVSNALGKPRRMGYKSNIRSIEHSFDVFSRSTTVSAPTIERDLTVADRAATSAPRRTSSNPRRTAPVRPGRRSGRSAAPQARPGRSIPSPTLRGDVSARARSCTVTPAATMTTSRCQLTDRGIAAILVVTAMIVVAAVAVIGLTVVRVSGPDYHPTGALSAEF